MENACARECMGNTMKISISDKGFRRILSGHPWIYRDDLTSGVECEDGDIVDVLHRENFIGRGFYSATSKISIRIITRHDERIDRNFWERRVLDALRMRERAIGDSDAYRLIFSEADGIPSLIIDRYGRSFSMQTLSPGADRLKHLFAEIIADLFDPISIYERNDAAVRQLEGLDEVKGELFGKTPDQIDIREGSIKLRIDIKTGQKTGAYLDQRENRINAERYFSGNVLDCFTYQGAFALHAAGKARHVTAIDSSADALRIAQENACINSMQNIHFEQANVFDYLKMAASGSESFDAVVLDPPAFARSRGDLKNAMRAYLEINRKAMKAIKPGGFLITSSCSYNLSEEDFISVIRKAAAQTRRSILIIEQRMQAADHPFLVTFPESHYLKSFILTVI